MKFEELNDQIPYAIGGKEKILTYSPYPNVTIAMPGRHQKDTLPIGGDFVIMVTDPVFKLPNHQFTHDDIFLDVQLKQGTEHISFFISRYADVVIGDDPDKIALGDNLTMPGINFDTFLRAGQCLAVAEHRRYAKYENKFGGRFLPLRFAAGIAEGLWTAVEASAVQRMGRPGVEMLEKQKGVPALTKELTK